MSTGVYFDLDGTLLEYETPFSELFARTVPAEATPGMAEAYTERILAALTDMEPDPYERAFRGVCEEYGIDGDPGAMAEEYVRREVEATRVPPSVRRLVEAVAARHPTGILTNGDGPMQRRKVAAHGLDDLVDAVLVSNDLGIRKPDPEIFREAADRLPADTHVYVGDTYEEDVEPAREAGFLAVYVGEEHCPGAPVAADGTGTLAELLVPLLGSSRE